MRPQNLPRNTETDFWARAKLAPSGCWEWTRTRLPDGYGQIRWKGRMARAHRLAWELTNGPIPTGLHVLHRCDNPGCINPDHLWLGTHLDNMADRERKGRWHPGSGEASPASKLRRGQVIEIRARRAKGETFRALGEAFGVNLSTIAQIIYRKTWRDV